MKKLVTIGLLLLAQIVFAADNFQVFSPGSEIRLMVNHADDGTIHYSIDFKARQVILPSTLGFVLFQPSVKLNKFVLLGSDKRDVDDTWKPVWGEVSSIRDHYSELVLKLKDVSGSDIELNIVFRVFDDGVAFRYEFPTQEKLNHFVVADELTQFAM